MDIPRIVIAGATSGVGKTTIATAIMYSLRKKKGLVVQPFKAGPDFIDPSYHNLVTGRKSRNLDVWLMGKRGIIDSFRAATQDADLAVVEGVMGLFDGMSGKSDFASTAHIAKILQAQVIIVVDAGKGARSIAAIVLGFLRFDAKTRIVGVILNNVASERHAEYLRDALSKVVGARIFGIIYRNPEIRMEERHLGLVPAQELERNRRTAMLNAAKYLSDQIDIEAIFETSCESLQKKPLSSASKPLLNNRQQQRIVEKVTIAVALDESFNFYYADNLDALKMAGAQLIFFSPINDNKLPDNVDGVILGGGFPEVLADRLEINKSMIGSIKKAAGAGVALYGECGGLMYLTRSIRGYKKSKRSYKMTGIVDADTLMTSRLTLNYTEAKCDGPIFGQVNLHGHEFHYSTIDNISDDSRFAYTLSKGRGITSGKDGFVVGDNCLAAYMHLHFMQSKLAKRFVSSCLNYNRS